MKKIMSSYKSTFLVFGLFVTAISNANETCSNAYGPNTQAVGDVLACLKADGGSQKKVKCPGKIGVLIVESQIDYCQSCAFDEQGGLEEVLLKGDTNYFFENKSIKIGQSSPGLSNSPFPPTCLHELPNTELGYIEYAQRKTLCASRKVAAITDEEIADQSKNFAKNKALEISTYGAPEEQQKQLNTMAKKFKKDNKCKLGVFGEFQSAHGRSSIISQSSQDRASEQERVQKNMQAIAKNDLIFCDPLPRFENLNEPIEKGFYEGILVDASGMFESNSSELSEENVSKMKANISEQIKNNPYFKNLIGMKDEKGQDCIHQILRVEIQSSANQIRNSPPNKPWGFRELAQKRADEVKNKILKDMKLPGIKEFYPEGKAVSYVLGDYQSGVSGPCPYRYNRDTFRVETLPQYDVGGKDRADIDNAKAVKVLLQFQTNCKISLAKTNVKVPRLTSYNCMEPVFKCVENIFGK